MKHYPSTTPAPRTRPRLIPPFQTVPIARQRHDGWSPRRQAEFIGHLAETRSVSMAARRVSMAREGAYALRRRPGSASFRAAWDAALGQPARSDPFAITNLTRATLAERALAVWWQVRLDHGKFVGLYEKHDNSALLRFFKVQARGAAAAQRLGAAAKVTSLD